jgi:hypothetical protein
VFVERAADQAETSTLRAAMFALAYNADNATGGLGPMSKLGWATVDSGGTGAAATVVNVRNDGASPNRGVSVLVDAWAGWCAVLVGGLILQFS